LFSVERGRDLAERAARGVRVVRSILFGGGASARRHLSILALPAAYGGLYVLSPGWSMAPNGLLFQRGGPVLDLVLTLIQSGAADRPGRTGSGDVFESQPEEVTS